MICTKYFCVVEKLRSSRPVAVWLLIGVVMIMIQIILGGVTRLTGSGLSITEWKPILGAIPPVTEQEWNTAFEKYKQIAQFKHLNFYFSLEDFKSIYFWEWLHRVWGRLIGVVFLIPFFIFLFQHRFTPNMIRPLIILFLLGALQGAIGWLMVQSGLNENNLYVSHIRLTVHFMAALLLLVYTFWFALTLIQNKKINVVNPNLKKLVIIILSLLFIQFVFGAFMAGLKAATVAPTWPSINGEYIPANISNYQGRSMSFFYSLMYNPITIQFIHRSLAYLILLLIIVWTVKAFRSNDFYFNKIKWLPLFLACIQVGLGISAVLTSTKIVAHRWGIFEWMAQLHQVVAMLLFLSLVTIFYMLRNNDSKQRVVNIDTRIIK